MDRKESELDFNDRMLETPGQVREHGKQVASVLSQKHSGSKELTFQNSNDTFTAHKGRPRVDSGAREPPQALQYDLRSNKHAVISHQHKQAAQARHTNTDFKNPKEIGLII